MLLRSVNLGPHRKLPMAELRTLLVRIGFKDARTLLASGNVVLSGGARATASLESQLEAAVTKEFAMPSDIFVRTGKEWHALVKANPFPDAAKNDPARLVMLALKDAPKPAAVQALRAAIVGREIVEADGRQLYAIYPDGQGESRLTINVIEKHLGTRATGRNWNTVLKLAALVS